MKLFFKKMRLFASIVLIILTTVLLRYGAYIDFFYNKFTTPKATAMILGDSRSFQGIQPRIIDEVLATDFDLPMLNYSFTIAQISYDSLYLASIKRKLDTTKNKGLFIVSVHPWVLANRGKQAVTNQVPPHNMHYVTTNPNFEYLYKNINYFHFKSLIRKTANLHKDGWLEESNLPKDSMMRDNWKKHQVKIYRSFAKSWSSTNNHLDDLSKLIDYLKNFGKVYLIRMPVDNAIVQVESQFWNDFEHDMIHFAAKNKVNYISFLADSLVYKTYDGNHIDKYGGLTFTKDLSMKIKLNK